MGATKKQKEDAKAKGATKKKPTIKDILAKKNSGGKAKKKWSKTKTKEKVNNSVFWMKSSWDKCQKDLIAKEAYITPSIISEKLKVNVSLAREAIKELQATGRLVCYNGEAHSRWGLFVKSPEFIKN